MLTATCVSSLHSSDSSTSQLCNAKLALQSMVHLFTYNLPRSTCRVMRDRFVTVGAPSFASINAQLLEWCMMTNKNSNSKMV
eukprot:19376-Amphidinium_carterae.2